MESSVELINLSGRKVRVATRREAFLVSQGFRYPEAEAADHEPPADALEGLTKAELWALIKEVGLDDRVSYQDTKDAMIEALSGE